MTEDDNTRSPEQLDPYDQAEQSAADHGAVEETSDGGDETASPPASTSRRGRRARQFPPSTLKKPHYRSRNSAIWRRTADPATTLLII